MSIQLGSSLAVANNNPGNLRYVGQVGATQGEKGFAKFNTPEAGYEALQNQVSLDASRGLNCGQFVNKYAPPTENDTATYVSQFCNSLGVKPTDNLQGINPDKVAQFIAT